MPLICHRPFREPYPAGHLRHHTISHAGLVGGGQWPRPGETRLAHRGVLLLDEMPEFGQHGLEVLRQPLEDGTITISRAQGSLTFPANCAGRCAKPLPLWLLWRPRAHLHVQPQADQGDQP